SIYIRVGKYSSAYAGASVLHARHRTRSHREHNFNVTMLQPQGIDFMSIAETQKTFGVSRSFIYSLRRNRLLKLYHVEAKPFIRVSEFQSLMKPEAMEA